MDKFKEIKRLQERAGRRAAVVERQQDPRTPNHAILERIEIERDLIDASGWLLAIASKFQPGDEILIAKAIQSVEFDYETTTDGGKPVMDCLRRLQKAARLMEEEE